MNVEKKYRNSFFDRSYFVFLFGQVWKNPLTHILSSLYFLLILLYALIMPLITKESPISNFSVPLTSLFLVFLAAITFTFISILIFRAPIDDGTEILIVTKPLTRFEILFVKVSVYISFLIIIGLVGSILATFVYVHSFSYYEDNLKIIFGTFVGTLACGLLFGGITTIVATFFRKTVVMLISISIVVFFMLYSLLSVFVISNPLKVLSKQDTPLLPLSIIKYDDKSKSSGLVQGASGQGKTSPQKLWNDAKEKTNYIRSASFDFGSQLSSLFTLAVPPSDYMQAIKNISAFNKPIDFVFDENYNLDQNIKSRFSISTNYDEFNSEGSNVVIPPEYEEDIKTIKAILEKLDQNEINSLKKKIDFVGIKKDFSLIKTNSKNGIFSQRNYEIGDFTRRNLSSNLWDEFWKTYGEIVSKQAYDEMWLYHENKIKIIESDSNLNSSDQKLKEILEKFKYDYSYGENNIPPKVDANIYEIRSDFNNPASIFLREIYNKEVIENKKSPSWFVGIVNELIMSGLHKYSSENKSILIHELFNPLTDFNYDVQLKDLFKDIKLNKPETISEIIKLVEKLLGNQVTISENTYVYEIIDYLRKNKKDLVSLIDKFQNKRNEIKTLINLMGFKVQPILERHESNIKTLLTIESWYIVQIRNISFTLKSMVESNYFEKVKAEKYYFSSAFNLYPFELLIQNSFKPASVQNAMDRNILIPSWIFVSLLLFVVGSIIYYKKDFS